jgi:rubrerythrin
MNFIIYNIEGKKVIVYDDHLYIEVKAESQKDDEPTADPAPAKRHYKKHAKTGAKSAVLSSVKKTDTAFRFGPEATETLIKDIAAGKSVAELAEKYEVSKTTIYNFKLRHKAEIASAQGNARIAGEFKSQKTFICTVCGWKGRLDKKSDCPSCKAEKTDISELESE